MKSIQMSRQVNLYLTQNDIEKIQKYLVDRNFIFIEDKILIEPKRVYTDSFFEAFGRSRYIVFPENYLTFRSWEQNGVMKFRLQEIDSTVLELNFFGEKEGIYRVRFYYCPYYFENHEKKFKNLKFGLHVERFFRWLRRNFVRMPNMPTFYQNPNFPVKELF